MRIGLISDTHIPATGPEPPPQVEQAFAGVDLILHAGHAYTSQCIDWLARIAPVEASESWIQGSGESLTRNSQAQVFELEGHTIGMTHELLLLSLGDEVLPGAIDRYYPKAESLTAELDRIFGRRVNIVVFGYTHQAMVETHEGILLVNPGSPSLIGQAITLGTVALLELAPGRREATVVDLTTLGQA
ncbi:MAG: metallophosphoesterase family protein [Chloroflexi bacterium]|nr:metallophosphoesterase family protein [Chloroflexota bacterium]